MPRWLRLLPAAFVAATPAVGYNLVFSPASPTVNESAGSVTLLVSLSGCANPTTNATWNVFAEPGSAPAALIENDFGSPAPSSFSIGAGSSSVLITVPLVDDDIAEPNEHFRVVLRPASPSSGIACNGTTLLPVQSEYRADVTIVDDDGQPQISIGDDTVREGDSGTRDAVFRVSVANIGVDTVRVNWATRDRTAQAPADYLSARGTVVLTANQPTADVVVQVVGDTLAEGDEVFFVDLSNPSGGVIADGRGRGTIRDDDGTPTPGLARLEAVGDASRGAARGVPLELAVRAVDDVGGAVGGVTVSWSTSGDVALSGGPTSVTDGSGIAIKVATLGGGSATAAVVARAGELQPVRFDLRLATDLGDLFDPGHDPGLASIAEVLDGLCSESSNRFAALCGYLGGLSPDDARRAITELAPTEAAAQADVAIETARAGLRTVEDRQRQLRQAARRGRSGAGRALALDLPRDRASARFAVTGFEQRGPDGAAGAAGAFDRESRRGGPRLDDAITAAMDRAIDGNQEAAASPGETTEVGAEEERGGLFLSGRITRGDRDATARDAGLDYDAAGGTLGVDYRTGAHTFLGIAGGYASSGADFTGGGDLSLEGENLTAYLTYAGDTFFVDLVAGYGRDRYTLRRRLTLPSPGGSLVVDGRGEPDGDERLAELGLGWDFVSGGSTWTLSGRASYVGVSIDRFIEALDSGGIELEIFDQDVESLVGEAAIEWVHAASFDWGVLQPQLSAALRHEFEDSSRDLRGRFVGDPAGGVFSLPSDPADSTYFAAKAGLTAIFPGGFAIYGNFEQELGRDGLSVSTASAGLRWEW